MSNIKVGDVYETKYLGIIVYHEVVTVEPNRIRLKVIANDYKFWLDREIAEKFWLTKIVVVENKM